MSRSSAFSSSSVPAVAVFGSSAMPHLGQSPGWSCCTSGCIGTGVDGFAREASLRGFAVDGRGQRTFAGSDRCKSRTSVRHARHSEADASSTVMPQMGSMAILVHCSFNGHANQPDAASFMILTIVSSTSCATPFSCGVLNIASRVVGFNVARMVLPPSS